MMESNSPGQSPRDEKRDARRERSRSRTRSGLSSKLNFFEYSAQCRKQSPSHSFERTESHETTFKMDIPAVEDSVFNQSEVDQLEREITERRQRLSRRDDDEERQRRPAVALRRVVSPVRVEVVCPPHQQQFATEVYISSWTERVRSPDPVQHSPPTPPPRDVQPPWRLARRSEPTTPAQHTSPFQAPTTPASALSKYQEWRARRLTSVESPEQIAPWRKQQIQRRTSKDGRSESPLEGRRSFEIESPPSNVRKGSQPQWYSEFRTASFTQTASRMDAFRVGGVKTHYDFHIAEIKGEIGIKKKRERKVELGLFLCRHSPSLIEMSPAMKLDTSRYNSNPIRSQPCSSRKGTFSYISIQVNPSWLSKTWRRFL